MGIAKYWSELLMLLENRKHQIWSPNRSGFCAMNLATWRVETLAYYPAIGLDVHCQFLGDTMELVLEIEIPRPNF